MNKNRTSSFGFVGILIVATCLIIYRRCDSIHAQSIQGTGLFDQSQISVRTDSFNLIFNGRVDGSMIVKSYYQNSELVLDVSTTWISQRIKEAELIKLNRYNFRVQSADVRNTLKNQTTHFNYLWTDNGIKGTLKKEQGGIMTMDTVSHLINHEVYERSSMILTLIPCLSLKEGLSMDQKSFMLLENEIVDSRLKVLDKEMITVPAGKFETFKVEFTTPAITNLIYITTSTPRRPVKYESVGYPISFELIKSDYSITR